MRIKNHIDPSFEENTYLVIEGNKGFIVDPGLDTKKVLEEYQDIEFLFILLTHCHIDHVDGINYFNIPIYISEQERQALFDDYFTLYNMFDLEVPYLDKKDLIKTLKDEEVIKFNNHDIKMILTPGHTKGSACFLLDNDYLFSGDTLFNNSIGRTDLPSGNEKEIYHSLDKLVNKLSNKVIILPGHGKNSTIKEEKISNPFLFKKN